MRALLIITACLILIAAIVPVHAVDYSFYPGPNYAQFAYTDFPPSVYNTSGTTAFVLPSAAASEAFCVGNGLTWANNPTAVMQAFSFSNTTRGSAAEVNYGSTQTMGGASVDNYTVYHVYCSAHWYAAKVWFKDSVYPTVIANFTGTPTQGAGPLPVLLADTSGNATSYNWSISPATGWTPISGTINSKDFYVNFVTNGNYTITHGAAGPFNSDIETKTDYIWVYNSTNLITTSAVARDLYTTFAITSGANVDMYDIENGSWTNTTDAPGGIGQISTLVGHHLNIYGSATGYSPDNLLNVDVTEGYYSLLLQPTNITTFEVLPGNLTLWVTVQELDLPHNTVSGAEVTAAWGSQYASGTSNAAGGVSFAVPNNTAIHLSAFKSGYTSGSKTHITGSSTGTSTTEQTVMYIGTDYVTPTVTATWTGTGTIPPTVDPCPCIGDGSAQDTICCQKKQGGMAASLITMGPDLVDFFIMLTIVGGLLLLSKGIK